MTDAPSASDVSEGPLLDTCPFCRYSLQGLATVQKCPECGHEVDRRWRVFGGPTISPKRIRVLLVLLSVTFLIPAALSLHFRLPNLIATVTYAAAMSLIMWRVLPTRVRPFLALADDGLHVYRKFDAPVFHAWPTIRDVRRNRSAKAIELVTSDGVVRYSSHRFFSADSVEVDRFVREMNDRLRVRQPRNMIAE